MVRSSISSSSSSSSSSYTFGAFGGGAGTETGFGVAEGSGAFSGVGVVFLVVEDEETMKVEDVFFVFFSSVFLSSDCFATFSAYSLIVGPGKAEIDSLAFSSPFFISSLESSTSLVTLSMVSVCF